ncbi:MAG TPA: LuxR C-terminal-related transcriptional regulator [Chloroflexota bacterium]|jgi:LuxR family maltose regulon positive regulatory protein
MEMDRRVERYPDPRLAVESRGADISSTTAVLATKLVVPAPRSNVVQRPRLIDQISAGARGPLTLLVAPAGFGKTTLLSAWCASEDGRRTPHAWVSLDVADADPARFWAHVITGAEQLFPGVGELALALLAAAEPPGIEAILGSLINGLASVEHDAVLILDDYHLVDTAVAGEAGATRAATSLHRGLAFLVEHLPTHLHVVISTRADPPMPLARLRARGDLFELRADDLRFDLDEARRFFDQTLAVTLTESDTAALEVRTEGWPAGLQLAGLALRHRGTAAERSALVAEFTGSDRFVIDYLAEEVLQQQSNETCEFLLRTSIVDRLNGALCDALVGAPDANGQVVLEALERASLFIVPLDRDRRWFRYHHLFADVLRARLAATYTAAEIAQLHERASAWFAAQQQPAEAIDHAVAARHFERAVALIEQSFTDGVGASLVRFVTIEQWLSALPQAIVRASPALCFFRAARLVGLSDMDVAAAESWLSAAEDALAARRASTDLAPSDVSGEIAWTRSFLATMHGDAQTALAAGRAALAELKPTNVAGRCYAALALCSAYVTRRELGQAEAVLTDGIALARAAENVSHANQLACSLSYVQRARGALRAAAETCTTALAWAARRGPSGRIDLGPLLASWADLQRERNELEAATSVATEAVVTSQQLGTPDQLALSTLVLARCRHAQSDPVAALAALEDLARLESKVPWLAAMASAVRAQLHPLAYVPSALARTPEMHIQSRARLLPYVYEHLWIAPISLLLARGDAGSVQLAMAELDALQPEADWLPWLQIKTFTLRALAHHALGDSAAALTALRAALALAEPEGHIRVLADEGASLSPLLRALRGQLRETAYVDYLLAVIAGAERSAMPVAGTIVAPLSARELDVLRRIAAGRSNAQIARELIVATSTVKTHVNNIFGKLGAANRAEAIARAYELNLV